MTDGPVLSEADRSKPDSTPDDAFYDQPRFVHHVDEGFRDRLTDCYREHLADGDHVLDAMSSWVSHLPPEREFARLLGRDGVVVVYVSNRSFRTKAVRVWRERSMDERAVLVRRYCDAGGFVDVETVSDPRDSMVPGRGGDPFYAVVARPD